MALIQKFKSFAREKGELFLGNQTFLKTLLERFGFCIVRNNTEKSIPSYPFRLVSLLNKHQVTTVFDVGACNGYYAADLRRLGYKNKIISFEPASKSYTALLREANLFNDPLWIFYNIALGDVEEKKSMCILDELPASSFLTPSQLHLHINPKARGGVSEVVDVKRLETFYRLHCSASESVFLKIDTQGYEKQVLLGLGALLEKITLIQLEVSFQSLYNGEIGFVDLLKFMKDRNFLPIDVDPMSFDSERGEFLQADILFRQTRPAVS
ncbi:MAG TPA: FkbM family methyltransferase [Chlamydiales bacterium]|nr:FkbM family methyltransferase [Chlamydiales bacterium]